MKNIKYRLSVLIFLTAIIRPAFAEPISVDSLYQRISGRSNDVVVVDARSRADYAGGTIRGAINLPLDFIAEKIKNIPKGKDIMVVSNDDATSRAAMEALKLSGAKGAIRVVEGGMKAWEDKYPVDVSLDEPDVRKLSTRELYSLIKDIRPYTLIDIRSKNDYAAGHIPTARSCPLCEVEKRLDTLDPDTAIIIYADDYDSALKVAKFLGDNGYSSLMALNGGFNAWVDAGYRVY